MARGLRNVHSTAGLVLATSFLAVFGRNLSYVIKLGWGPLSRSHYETSTNTGAEVLPRHSPFQMRSKTETGKHSLLIFDGVVTGVTHPDLELEAHDGVARALAAALAADSLAAFPAVVLQGSREEKRGSACASVPVASLRRRGVDGSGEDSPELQSSQFHAAVTTRKVDSFSI